MPQQPTAPQLPPVPTLPALPATKDVQRPMNPFEQAYMQTAQKMAKPNISDVANTPIASTKLADTERYTNPNIGFNAFDSNLEQKYADNQSWYGAIGNSLGKIAYAAGSSLVQTLAAIPYTLAGVATGKLDMAYNNPVVNTLDQWSKDLETSLPNYQTAYEKQHPYYSYVTPWNFKSFTNSWGNVLKNVGYTAGAIGGSVLIDSALAATTGGLGDAAVLPSQVARIGSILDKLGTAEEITANTGKVAKIFSAGTENVARLNAAIEGGEDLQSAVNKLYGQAKVADNFRYGFNLFNSALSIGALTANQTYGETKDELTQEFRQKYGVDPTGDDYKNIEANATGAGNTDFLINTAATMATDAISFGAMLKPTAAAQRAVRKEIAENTELKLSNPDTWELINPTKGYKGIIKRVGNAFGTELGHSVVGETLKGGFQMVSNSANADYWKRKYDEPTMDDTDNLLQSIGTGLQKTFLTPEGQQNLFMFALNGPVIHGIKASYNGARGINSSRQEGAGRVASYLNQQTLTGLFEHKYNETATAVSIAKDMNDAASQGDIYKYQNLRHDALYNFILSGAKSNRFGLRVQQLDSLKDLDEKQFKTLFQMEDTPENRKTVGEYVDSIKTKAFEIKKDIDKVNTAFGNPFNSRTSPIEYQSHEDYKDALGLALSKIRDNKDRLTKLSQETINSFPNLQTDKVANLSNETGINRTISNFKTRLAEINELAGIGVIEQNRQSALDERATKVSAGPGETNIPSEEEINKTFDEQVGQAENNNKYKTEKQFLQDKIKFLESNLKQSDPEEYLRGVKDILDYYGNGDKLDGPIKYDITDVQHILETGGDLYKLHQNVENGVDYYNTLVTKTGYSDFMDSVKAAISPFVSRIKINPDGSFAYRTPQQEQEETLNEQAKEAEKVEAAINAQTPSEKLTPEQNKALNEIVKAEKTGAPLTEEEEALKAEKPQAYANKKNALDKVQDFDKYEGQTFEDVVQPTALTPEQIQSQTDKLNDQRKKELEGINEEPKLPKDLAGAKPKYGFGHKNFDLTFDSDLDKAAYITAQNTKSARHDDYLKFIKDSTGMTEKQAKEYGANIRDYIKSQAKNADDGETINIPKQLAANPKSSDAINAKYDKQIADLTRTPQQTQAQQATKNSRPTIESDARYSGITPTGLLNKVLTQEFKDSQPRVQNLYETLFHKPIDLIKNLSAKIQPATFGKSEKEFTNIKGTNLYRQGYAKDIILSIDGKEIGQLQDGLHFKRDNDYVPIDQLKPEEYVRVTGNDPATYNSFMNEVKAYTGLVDHIKSLGKNELSTKEINDLLGKVSVFYGYPDVVNRAEQATTLGDAKYIGSNSVVLSFPEEYDPATGVRRQTDRPIVIGKNGVQEPSDEMRRVIDNNQELLKNNARRYVVMMDMPDGSFNSSSFIFARPVPIDVENLDDLHKTLQSGNSEAIKTALSDIYIADAGIKQGEKTIMRLTANNDGGISLNIAKRLTTKGRDTRRTIAISKEELVQTKDFSDLTKLIQGKIDQASIKDRNLRSLNISIEPKNVKQNIPMDENTNFNTFKDKLSLAVTPNVFRDASIYVHPKTGAVESKQEEVTVNNEPRTVPKESIVTNQTDVGPVSYVKEPNGSLSKIDTKSQKELEERNTNANKYNGEIDRLKQERKARLTQTDDLRKLDTILKEGGDSFNPSAKAKEAGMTDQQFSDTIGKRRQILAEYKDKIFNLEKNKSLHTPFESVTKPETKRIAITKAPEPIKENIDPRLTPAQPGAYGHMSIIQQTYRSGDYSKMLREGTISEDQLHKVLTSMYGEENANKFTKTVKWQSDPNNIKRMDTIADWSDYSASDYSTLMEGIIKNGNLKAAIENDFLPISDALEIAENHKLPTDILDTINDKVNENNYKQDVASEIAEGSIEKKEPITKESLQEEPSEKVQVETVDPIQPTEPIEENDNAPIQQGDKVTFKGKEYFVDQLDDSGIARLMPSDGQGRHEYAGLKQLEKVVEDDKNDTKHDPVYRVSERMQQLFPGLKLEIGNFTDKWKGKFDKGTVKINLKYATLDTPIHEYMHPFIAAIKDENPTLYENISKELYETDLGRQLLDEVKEQKEYASNSHEDQHDEALVRYISNNIADVLDKDGNIDEEKLQTKRKGFIDVLYNWFRQIHNLIFGVDRNVKFNTFVDKLNKTFEGDYQFVKVNNPDKNYKTAFSTLTGLKTIALNEAKYGRLTVPETFFDELKSKVSKEEYDKIVKEANKAIKKTAGANEVAYQEFNRITYDPVNQKLKFYKPDSDNPSKVESNVRLQDLPSHVKDVRDLNAIRQMIQQNEGKTIDYSIPSDRIPTDISNTNRAVSVSDIPGNINASQLADLLIVQDRIQFDLSSQQNAFNQMEAYQYANAAPDQEDADTLKEKLGKRLDALEHIVSRRLPGNSQALSSEYYKLRALHRDFEGTDLVAKYVKSGISSLDYANSLITDINKTFRDGHDLSDAERSEAVRKYGEAKTFIGLYDDVEKLLNEYEDLFPDEEDEFRNIIGKSISKRRSIDNISANIATSWLYPVFVDRMQEVIRRNPERQDLLLSKQEFKQKLRMADKDSSFTTYWLGATINSRDPINATVALAVNEALIKNRFDEDQERGKRNVAFTDFLKTSGIANNEKTLENFYKQNYLKQIEVWERVGYNQEENKPIEDYVKRWAFHQEYNYHTYEDNFRKFMKSLPEPITKAQENEHFDAIKRWHDNNSVVIPATYDPNTDSTVGGGYKPNSRYKNADYDTVKNQPLFKQLLDTYNKGNDLYGERKLKYGMIPQAFKESGLLGGAKERLQDIREGVGEKAPEGTNAAAFRMQQLGEVGKEFLDASKAPREQYKNFDSSYYKDIKTNFLRPLDDNQLDFKLHETVLDMYRDANTYNTMRTMQTDAENVKDLINGNETLGIRGRKIVASSRGNMVWDRLLGTPQEQEKYANKLNQQLTQYINDIFFGDSEFESNLQLGKTNVNLNRMGKRLRQYVTADTMMINVMAGLRSASIRAILSTGEAVGGRNFKFNDLRMAYADYIKNMPELVADFNRIIKSRYSQIMTHYDMMQGETRRNNYGKKVTGAVYNKLMSTDTLHFVTQGSEHLVQATAGFAHLMSIDVPTKSGKKMTLADAWVTDKNGIIKLHDDAIWSKEDDLKATLELQQLNRQLHGNYAPEHKAVLQRYWWGNLALVFRKFIYENARAKFASERTDLESGDVMQGYYRGFANKLVSDIKDYKFNLLKIAQSQIGRKGWTDHEKYYARKTIFDIGTMGALFTAISLLTPSKKDKDKMGKAQANLLLLAHAAYGDVAAYSVDGFGEVKRQIQNPSAAVRTLDNFLGVFNQLLTGPSETYQQNGVNYKAGDSKLGHQFTKAVPLLGTYNRLMNPQSQLQFYGGKAYQ
jgi:hypothetical protein